MTKKPKQNRKAMLTDRVVNGLEKILKDIPIANVLCDPEAMAGVSYLQKTITNWRAPEAVEHRKRIVREKNEWTEKKRAAGELPPAGKRGRPVKKCETSHLEA